MVKINYPAKLTTNWDVPLRAYIDQYAPANGGRAVGQGELLVSIRDYGAKGDGIADDTAAIQSALNAAAAFGGGLVFAPPGRYLAGAFTVPSAVAFVGTPGTTFVVKGTPAVWLTVAGTLGAEVSLAAAATAGDLALTTGATHGLVAGDLGRLISQRDALTSDAGPEWQLGNNTPTATTCYFGEIVRVAAAPSSTTVTLDVGLLFPNYRPDKTLETAATARNAATIAKITPARDVRIGGFKVEGSASTALILVQLGYNVRVEDVDHRATGNGPTVIFEASLSCRGQNCRTIYPDQLTDDASHALRNAYKTHGSQDCGYVGCHNERATQGFDITYGGLTPRMPSIGCYVEMCSTKGAISNPATTHPGTYASRIVNNRFLENRGNGIANRSRNAVILGNTVSGSRAAGSYGIELYEGWARNCVISGNVVHGFELPIAIQDGTDPNEFFAWVGATITDNILTQFGSYGISAQRSSLNKFAGETGVTVRDNKIIGSYWPNTSSKGVYTGKYSVGWKIRDNVIDLSGIGNGGVHVPADSGGHHIEGNTILNGSNRGVWVDAPTDAVVWPTGVTITLGTGNRILNTPTRYFLGAGVTIPSRFNQGGSSGGGAVLTVSGSRGSNAALTDLLAKLAAAGLITDTTTA